MLPLRKFNNLNYLELFFKASSVIETFLVFGILLGFGLLLCNSTNSGIFPSQISTLLHSDLSFGILPLVFPTKILLQWWNGPTRALFYWVFHVCVYRVHPRDMSNREIRAEIQGLTLIIWYQQPRIQHHHPPYFPTKISFIKIQK
jgi:hypothetical protein